MIGLTKGFKSRVWVWKAELPDQATNHVIDEMALQLGRQRDACGGVHAKPYNRPPSFDNSWG